MSNIKISVQPSTSTNLFQDLSNNDAETVMGGSIISNLIGIDIKLGDPGSDGLLPVERFIICRHKIID